MGQTNKSKDRYRCVFGNENTPNWLIATAVVVLNPDSINIRLLDAPASVTETESGLCLVINGELNDESM